jgi:hypothetical protein
MSKAIDYTNVHAVMSTMMTGNAYDAKKITASIKSLATMTAKVDARAHATAMAIFHRSLPTDMGGDMNCDGAAALVDALGKGGRKNAMIAWLHEHTNIRIVSAKGKPMRASMLKPGLKMYRELTWDNVETARLNPYWEQKALEGVAPLTDQTLIARLEGLLKAVEREGVTIDNGDNVKLLSAIRTRVATHKAAMQAAA